MFIFSFIKNLILVLIEMLFGSRSQNETAAKIVTFALAAGALILLFALAKCAYVSYRVEETRTEVQATKNQAIRSEANSEVLEDQLKEQNQNADEIQKKSVQAGGNYNAVRNVDSGIRDGSFSAVRKRWCEDHRNDSKCSGR